MWISGYEVSRALTACEGAVRGGCGCHTRHRSPDPRHTVFALSADLVQSLSLTDRPGDAPPGEVAEDIGSLWVFRRKIAACLGQRW